MEPSVANDGAVDSDNNNNNINNKINLDGKQLKKFSDYVILLGGAGIVSYALRTRLLGKMLRTVEVPHGNMSTIILRRNSVKALKETIIKNQPPIYPGVELKGTDIHVSVFAHPHFSELITTNAQCRALDEGTYILWTKMGLDIPKNGIDLRSFSKETFAMMASQKEKDEAIRAITYSLTTPPKKIPLWDQLKSLFVKKEEVDEPPSPSLAEIDITEEEKKEIVEILVDDVDKDIVSLCARYKDDPSRFRWHAVNILRTRKRFTGKT